MQNGEVKGGTLMSFIKCTIQAKRSHGQVGTCTFTTLKEYVGSTEKPTADFAVDSDDDF